jgi:predicted heme/steroid binding protein
MTDEKKKFTREELAEFNGQKGNDSYVAVNGKVYDVTDGPTWEDGDHVGEHRAGEDLTAAMEDAPHGMEVFEEFPEVGELE